VQRFVEAHERARLAFHARRELSRVTAVASEVMAVDSRLADAEEQLGQAVGQRSAAAAAVSGRSADRQPPAAGERTAGDDAARQRPAPGAGPAPGSGAGPAPGQRSRLPLLGPWAEAAILAAAAAGEAVLAYVAARDLGLALLPIGLLTLTVAISTVAAAQLAAHGIDRLAAGRDGLDDPHRRRWLDVGMGGAALASGMALAIGVGRLTARAGTGVAPHAGARAGAPACAGCPGLGASHVIVLGLALLGLATAVAYYAAIPDRAGAAKVHRWRALTAFLRQAVEDRRGRRQLRVATAQEAAAHAAVRQLREQLAVLVPQLFAAEQAALLFWSYQVAIGDAAQHALRQHLSAFATQRSRGVRKPLVDWWSGTAPLVPEVRLGFTSIGEAQWDWAEQMGRVTMAAKRVLVRRGLLDITYGLRLSRLEMPSADPGGAATRPAGGGRDPADGHGPSHGDGDGDGDGERPPTVLPAFPLRQPDERA